MVADDCDHRKKSAGDCIGGFAGARDGRSCNLSGRNHLLDVGVIIVIRDISRRATVEIWTLGLFRAGTPRPNHPGITCSDFKRAGIFCPANRIRTLRSTRRCGLTEGFMCPVFVNFPILAAIRRNAILPECRFSCALLNTFLEQLKGAFQAGNIPTERALAPTKRAFILYDRCVR